MDIAEAYKNKLIDFYQDAEMLLLFGFTLNDIDNRKIKYRDIHKAIFGVFKELASSKNKRMQETVFTIYLGDYNGFYWVGIRANIPFRVSELFRVKFENLYGNNSHFKFESEHGRYPDVPLIPKYKYDKGIIVEYDGEEMLGKTRIDTDEWYGSGLKVIYKQILPCSFRQYFNQ